MKRALICLVFAAAACVGGVLVGQLLCGSISFRKWSARFGDRGELIALVERSGIYADDFSDDATKKRSLAEAKIEFESRREKVPRLAVDREYAALKGQIAEEGSWMATLQANRLNPATLRLKILKELRAERWVEQQLNTQRPGTDECRSYFERHSAEFVQPERFRAAHIFLAAPAGTSDEIVDVKHRTMEVLLARLDKGEKLGEIVPMFSEDESTRKRKGDIGWFSNHRMPDEFMQIVRQLSVGQTSRVAQTGLGFHIVQLLDKKPARQMSFEEAEPEIQIQLGNAKRQIFLQKLVAEASP